MLILQHGGINTGRWLYNVAASGTIKCPAALPDTRGEDYNPINWSINYLYNRNVAYFESSTEGQYIDTCIDFDKTQNMKLEVETACLGNWRAIILGCYAPGIPNMNIEWTADHQLRGYAQLGGSGTFDQRKGGLSLNTKYKVIFEYDATNNKFTLKCDNVLVYEQTIANGANSQQSNFRLFLDNRPSSQIKGSTRVYSAKLWKNNILVRNMIPVIGNTNNPGMFDYISHETFYNLGSGSISYQEL